MTNCLCADAGAWLNYRFLTQKERDNETGLDYFGARYYSSTQGRFTSPDVPFVDQWVTDPQSWNLYSYVRNNPLRLVDPTGYAAEDPCDEICKKSKAEAEKLRKEAEAEGIPIEVVDSKPAYMLILLVSEPRSPSIWDMPDDIGADVWRVGKFAGIDDPTFYIMPGRTAASGLILNSTKIGFSSTGVANAAKALAAGAKEVSVATRSEAEELLLRLYQGNGYRDTTGMTGREVRTDLFLFPKGKYGTYHFDEADLMHGGRAHLQVHTESGDIIRIFY